MPREHDDVIAQRANNLSESVLHRRWVGSGEVSAADRSRKEHIPRENDAARLTINDDIVRPVQR